MKKKLKKTIKNRNKRRVLYTCIILFVISFLYILFFTNHIPFFWDDHQFHQSYFRQSASELTGEFFRVGSDSIESGPRTVYAIFFKTLFYLNGYNIVMFRAAKAVIFALLIVSLFYFSNKYIKDYTMSLLFSFFVMFSFSLYIHTLVYDEPYIIAELFKVAAFYLFFKDFHQKKTSTLRQFSIAIFGLLAIRTYQPAYSIPLIIGLFIVFSRFKNIKRYIILLAFLFATNFPFKSLVSLGLMVPGSHSASLIQVKKFLFNNALDYVVSPAISLQSLYYKPFIAIITFFGFWLFVVALAVYLLRKRLIESYSKYFAKKTKKNPYSYKSLALFLCVWILGELPLWLLLPEHAVRYVNAIMIPMMMLYFILISKTLNLFGDRYKRAVLAIIIVLVSLACLTNIAYTAVFRAGWGSSFVGMEKVTDYIEQHREENSLILYYSQSVAFDYLPMNIRKPTLYDKGEYELINEGVEYRQVRTVDGFSVENLKNLSRNYTELYVIKRVTGFLKNEMPPVDFDSYPGLTLQEAINGTSPSLFDKTMSVVAAALKIDYEPQTFFVYKYSKKKN